MIIVPEDDIAGGVKRRRSVPAWPQPGRRPTRPARLVPPSAKLPGRPRVTPGIVLAVTDHDRNGGRGAGPAIGGGRGAGGGRGPGGWDPAPGGSGADGWDPGPDGSDGDGSDRDGWDPGPDGPDRDGWDPESGGPDRDGWDPGPGGPESDGWDSGPGDRWEQGSGGRGELAGSPPILEETGRQILDWARARSIGASSVFGISVVLTLCAAVWVTAGTRSGNFRASAALLSGYLVLLAGRGLLARPAIGARRARGLAGAHVAALARTFWLATLGWTLSECAIYAGLAIGATADHWPGMWILAIAVLSLVGVRELMAASAWPVGPEDPDRGLLRRAAAALMRMPAGGRLLLIGFVGPVWGNRAVLFALLDWTIIAIGLSLASYQGPPRMPARSVAPEPARKEQRQPAEPLSLAVLLVPADGGPAEEDVPLGEDASAEDTPALAEAGLDGSALADADAESAAVPPETAAAVGLPPLPAEAGRRRAGRAPRQRAEVTPEEQLWRERLIMLRDDGVLARYLGSLVRGNLLPLPPAVLGLVATALLAHLGLQSLPGILVLSPCLIMLLAAPGSGSRHAGRLDWLVPAVLLGWQCLYIAEVGQAQGVPTPVSFALCAAVMLRFADLACPGRPVVLARPMRRNWAMEVMEADHERGTALGWEGRMLLLGIGAAAGIGMFAYLALTAYLGGLICVKVVISSARVREGDGR